METLWPVVMEMGELWSASEGKGGTPGLGDVWPCEALRQENGEEQYVCFHLLSQWLVYSLLEPMEKLLGAIVEGTEQLTVPPEYRNGKYFLTPCNYQIR